MPAPPGVWRSQGQSRAAVEILTVSTAGSLERNGEKGPETILPSVIREHALTRRGTERCPPGRIPSHAFHLRAQFSDVVVEDDFAIGCKEGADVGLRVAELRGAECGELEDAEIGAVAVAGRIAERWHLLMHVEADVGSGERADEIFAVEGTARPAGPPGGETQVGNGIEQVRARSVAGADEGERGAVSDARIRCRFDDGRS